MWLDRRKEEQRDLAMLEAGLPDAQQSYRTLEYAGSLPRVGMKDPGSSWWSGAGVSWIAAGAFSVVLAVSLLGNLEVPPGGKSSVELKSGQRLSLWPTRPHRLNTAALIRMRAPGELRTLFSTHSLRMPRRPRPTIETG